MKKYLSLTLALLVIGSSNASENNPNPMTKFIANVSNCLYDLIKNDPTVEKSIKQRYSKLEEKYNLAVKNEDNKQAFVTLFDIYKNLTGMHKYKSGIELAFNNLTQQMIPVGNLRSSNNEIFPVYKLGNFFFIKNNNTYLYIENRYNPPRYPNPLEYSYQNNQLNSNVPRITITTHFNTTVPAGMTIRGTDCVTAGRYPQ